MRILNAAEVAFPFFFFLSSMVKRMLAEHESGNLVYK
jgi:hypothetical protein